VNTRIGNPIHQPDAIGHVSPRQFNVHGGDRVAKAAVFHAQDSDGLFAPPQVQFVDAAKPRLQV
jgi:hypothetical protein